MMPTQDEIRKAYFGGKLNQLLDKMSAAGQVAPADLAELEAFLETLKAERRASEKMAARSYGELEAPSVDELMGISEADKAKLEAWIADTGDTVAEIKRIMQGAYMAVKNRQHVKLDEWLEYGLQVITLMFSVDQLEIIQEQLYMAKLTRLIDVYGMSRAEAENRSKLTREYREFKKAQRLKENILEFEMLAKKYAGLNS